MPKAIIFFIVLWSFGERSKPFRSKQSYSNEIEYSRLAALLANMIYIVGLLFFEALPIK